MDNLLNVIKANSKEDDTFIHLLISYLLLMEFWEQNFLYFHEEKPLKDQSVSYPELCSHETSRVNRSELVS